MKISGRFPFLLGIALMMAVGLPLLWFSLVQVRPCLRGDSNCISDLGLNLFSDLLGAIVVAVFTTVLVRNLAASQEERRWVNYRYLAQARVLERLDDFLLRVLPGLPGLVAPYRCRLGQITLELHLKALPEMDEAALNQSMAEEFKFYYRPMYENVGQLLEDLNIYRQDQFIAVDPAMIERLGSLQRMATKLVGVDFRQDQTADFLEELFQQYVGIINDCRWFYNYFLSSATVVEAEKST